VECECAFGLLQAGGWWVGGKRGTGLCVSQGFNSTCMQGSPLAPTYGVHSNPPSASYTTHPPTLGALGECHSGGAQGVVGRGSRLTGKRGFQRQACGCSHCTNPPPHHTTGLLWWRWWPPSTLQCRWLLTAWQWLWVWPLTAHSTTRWCWDHSAMPLDVWWW